MKAMFTGYYTPTEEEFKTLWSECLFVFDTNTLLNLYRYSKDSRELLFKVIETIGDRIWIPHQIALEYHKHMLDEIYNQENAYRGISDKVKTSVDTLESYLNNLRHSNINVEKIIMLLEEVNEKIQNELETQKESQPDLDLIKERISKLFKDRVGDEYDQLKLEDIYKKGAERYENKIPPGYKDAKDKDNKITINNGQKYLDKFGDLVYWMQILDKSKEDSVKSIILITDDNKEDWVLEVKGQKKGPQPELVHEFKKASRDKLFYLYNTEQFLEYAKKYLKMQDGPLDGDTVEKAIKDVRSTKEFLHEFDLNYNSIDTKIFKKLLNQPDFSIQNGNFDYFFTFETDSTSESLLTSHLGRDIYFLTGVEVDVFVTYSSKKRFVGYFSTEQLLPDNLHVLLNNINLNSERSEQYRYKVINLIVFSDGVPVP